MMLASTHRLTGSVVGTTSKTLDLKPQCGSFKLPVSRAHRPNLSWRKRLQPVLAVSDDDSEPELPEEPVVTDISSAVADAEEAVADAAEKVQTVVVPGSKIAEVKAQLLDSLFGTERGLSASSEVRAEVNELVTQLEALNPTPSPNEAAGMLEGEWKLVYTSASELIGLLALNKLPLVTVGDITQTIDSTANSVTNKVNLSVPFARTAFSTTASFSIRSPKLLNIKFEKGSIATPQLLEGIELPNNVTVMGQTVDLKPLEDALSGVRGPLQDAVGNVARLVSQQPDLQFPIAAQVSQTWLLNTYLDDDTRITRGDLGSVFILVKEVSIQPTKTVDIPEAVPV